jgi:hypothetical protein
MARLLGSIGSAPPVWPEDVDAGRVTLVTG